ncbi:MAG: ferrochelatase [Fidelibacterota bacterium]
MSTPIDIVLANLGAPSNLEEVRPFLKNLFSDPDIFHFPFGRPGQVFFSELISRIRTPKSRKYYQAIGGGSPLHENTTKQADKLQRILGPKDQYRVWVAQRYWNPFMCEIADELRKLNSQKIILLPLYPHYSTTTTLSIVNEWERSAADLPKTHVIERFYSEPLYLKSCADQIQKCLDKSDKKLHILFSAHSIPVERVNNGDPYESEITENMELIMDCLNREYTYSLCYQSKVGPVKWLEPSVEQEIDRLVSLGIERVVVFPISFVSEHLETLYELDIQKKDYALSHGIKEYQRARTVGDSDDFIQLLAKLIKGKINE